MRSDLNKLLCERPRHGSSRKFHDVRRLKKAMVDDEVGGRESMTWRHKLSWGDKELAENLAPLWGLVRKNAGRPWDEVYGEICQVFDRRRVINQHIFQHLFDFVETKTYIGEAGVVWVRKSWGSPCPIERGWAEYYVHPVTGLLLKIKKKFDRQQKKGREARKAAEDAKVRRVINKNTELRLRGDVWFVCTLADFPADRREWVKSFGAKEHEGFWVNRPSTAYDQFERKTVQRGCPHARYVAAIRTTSHKELKKHGVIE